MPYPVSLDTGRVRKWLEDSDLGFPQQMELSRDGKYIYSASAEIGDTGHVARVRISTKAVHTNSPSIPGTLFSLAIRPTGGFLVGDITNDSIDFVSQDGSKVKEFSANPELNSPYAMVIPR